MSKLYKDFPLALPLPPVDLNNEITNGKSQEVLDVRISTFKIPVEDMDEPHKWMFPLFNKIEKAFKVKMGSRCMDRVALTTPLIREIRGDFKSKSMMVTVIAVDVTPIIKAEGIYD